MTRPIRIAAMGDVHLEFRPYPCPDLGADLVVLAGDMHVGADAIPWARDAFPGTPVVYVPGNHEFYHHDLPSMLETLRGEAAATDNVRLLENNEAVFEFGERCVRVLGCALWTDFAIDGEENRPAAEALMSGRLNDFRLIGMGGRVFTTADARALHAESRKWLDEALARPFDGATVVATHHAPSLGSVRPQSRNIPHKAGFASNLDDLILKYAPELWIHGHTHHNVDYVLGATRIVASQRGYPEMMGRPEENPGFEPQVIEI